jgi:hypothetical protein
MRGRQLGIQVKRYLAGMDMQRDRASRAICLNQTDARGCNKASTGKCSNQVKHKAFKSEFTTARTAGKESVKFLFNIELRQQGMREVRKAELRKAR